MLSSLMAFTACDNTSSSSSSEKDTSVTKTDTCRIANGNFEYFSDPDFEKVIITSPTGWSKSTGNDGNGNSASASTKDSGIIDLSKWDDMTESTYEMTATVADEKYTDISSAMKEAKAHWDEMSTFDKLSFRETFKKSISGNSSYSLSDFEYYYDYNIDKEDLPDFEWKGKITHDKSTLTEEDETGVLMIHNYATDGYGTAQKYTSSTTVTIEAGTAVKLSVWVKTADLKYNNGAEVTSDRGAYIGVTNTVGGTTLDQMQIKNIIADEWTQYTVYVNACSYASSTVTLDLGLGQQTGKDNAFEYVQGYAFFDDVKMEVISESDYTTATKDATCNGDSDNKKFVDSDAYTNKTFGLDLNGDTSFATFNINSGNTTIDYTTYKINGTEFVKDSSGEKVKPDTPITEAKWTTLKEITGNNEDTDSMLYLYSANGTAYTAKTPDFTLGSKSYQLISFWVKTSDVGSYTGASVTLIEKTTEKATVLGPLNTTTIATVDLDDEHKDINNGWVRCFFFVANETDDDKEYHLEFSYGVTSVNMATAEKSAFVDGWAAFTKFETKALTMQEYAYAGTSGQSAKASLTGVAKPGVSGFDSPIDAEAKKIETTLAKPKNYTALTNDSSVYTGLLNKEYAQKYVDNTENSAWLNAINCSTTDALTTLLGDASQPLLIANAVNEYRYYKKAATLSANAYSSISVRVKVSADATATIKLVDTSDPFAGYTDTLKFDGINASYWYDDNGNVCDKDPSDKDFTSHNIAFTLTDNGWYVVNKSGNWYKNLTDKSIADGRFANLANYKEENGNLVVKTDAKGDPIVSYAYETNYDDDGIAYYGQDGKYYAYKNRTCEVKNFPDEFITTYARYLNKTYKTPSTSFEGTLIGNNDGKTTIEINGSDVADKWVTVNFYIHNGKSAKDYRLELSGKGTYILFDECFTKDVSADFQTLIEDAYKAKGLTKDTKTGKLYDGTTLYEGAEYYAYSFRDDPAFQRYDVALDKKESGNPYTSYKQSSQEEFITYFYADNMQVGPNTVYTKFIDFYTYDQTVEGDTVKDEAESTAENKWWESSDFWLMLSSIILAIVLVLVMIIMLFTRTLKKFFKNKVSSKNHYDSKKKRYIRKLNLTEEDEEDEE